MRVVACTKTVLWYSEWEKRDVFVRKRVQWSEFKNISQRGLFSLFMGKNFSDRMSACVFVFYHFSLERHEAQKEREEKTSLGRRIYQRDGGGEQLFFSVFFVGCDREVRRYLFHSYFTEIEWNGSQILVWSEWWNESVGEEIISQEGVEKEV